MSVPGEATPPSDLILSQTVSEVDQKWADLAARRLQDIQTGTVTPVAGEDVFAEIWRRFD
jgi:Putative addiction module component